MLNSILRMVAWRGLSKLLGGKAVRNARMADRALRMARRLRR
ncbi:MAG: hypothetical protein AAGE03_12925 [Pseudomonadota bacterium]